MNTIVLFKIVITVSRQKEIAIMSLKCQRSVISYHNANYQYSSVPFKDQHGKYFKMKNYEFKNYIRGPKYNISATLR